MDRQNKLKESTLSFFNNLFDLMVLNWLWLICSIPIVTVGPATCGLYDSILRLLRGESVNPWKEFFRGFRSNLREGFLLGLAALVMLAAVLGDAWFAMTQTGMLRTVYVVTAVIIAVIWLIFLSYTFALQVTFEAPLKTHIVNAFKLAVIAPGKTVSIWLILMLPVLAAVLLPPVALKMLGFLYLVAGVSGPVYFAGSIQRKVFGTVSGKPVVDEPPTSE